MPRITTAGGAATAALVVALGIATPAAAADHADHADHTGGQTAATDHGDHSERGSGGAAPEDAAPEDHGAHSDHGSGGAAPEDAAPEDHTDHGSPAEEESSHEGGHGGEPDTVSDGTRVSVLGGFGAVNAAVIGSAFLLRRRDRRTGKQPRTNRRSHR